MRGLVSRQEKWSQEEAPEPGPRRKDKDKVKGFGLVAQKGNLPVFLDSVQQDLIQKVRPAKRDCEIQVYQEY